MKNKILDQINKVFANWYLRGNRLFHTISDFLYGIACNLIKIYLSPSEKEIEEKLEHYSSRYPQEKKEGIRKDMKYCWKKYGFLPDEYFMYHIYDCDGKRRKAFVSFIDKTKICAILNSRESMRMLRNKFQTYQNYKEFYKREIICGEYINDSFIEKNPRFIVKENKGRRGIGTFIVDAREYASVNEIKQKIASMNDVICEELIHQDERLGKLHPESVNTLRVRTLKSVSGKTIIWYCTLRTGTGKMVVDNAFMGGACALVDPGTGIVYTDGFNEDGDILLFHPDSGIKFRGFQIPEWESLKRIVLKIADVTKDLGYVGWDLALSENGWVMVEGNGHEQLVTPQAGPLKPLKKELWDIIFDRFEF